MFERNEFSENNLCFINVPALKKIILITVILMLSGSYAGAEEYWRLRYFVPTSDESEITRGTSKASEKLAISGHSGILVFANGIGVGYSTIRTSGSLEGISYKFKKHSLDLSYTIGSTFSFTLGTGRLIYGRGELDSSGVNYLTERSSGEALFMNFGLPFLGGEILLGYRQNNDEYKNYQSQLNGTAVILADSVKLFSNQVNAGFGFLF